MSMDPLHQFVITPIIPIHVGGMDLSFTNSSLWMMSGVVATILFLSIGMRKKALVPGRLQLVAEMFYNFIAGIVKENIGVKGRKYLPFIITLFTVVLLGNMQGLIPYSFTYTSHIAVTFTLALTVFFAVIIFAFREHGLHYLHIFLPEGVPLALAPLIILIEIISFLVRPITLAVRLFANMMAGHIMLKVFASFSVVMLGAGLIGAAASPIPSLANVAVYVLETLVAFIQAYLFAILASVYLKDTVELDH